jgi:hypothetical protein
MPSGLRAASNPSFRLPQRFGIGHPGIKANSLTCSLEAAGTACGALRLASRYTPLQRGIESSPPSLKSENALGYWITRLWSFMLGMAGRVAMRECDIRSA